MRIDRRTELREATFLLLFRVDFHQEKDLQWQIKNFFDGEDDVFSEKEKEFIGNKVLRIAEIIESIDAALNEISIGWKVKRMAKVDLTILRLAYYEINYDENVPVSTAINEAVELAKSYGEETSPSFVNGILAKVVKNEN
ncbi:MAG: transcription antitermination factor NusB [Lachnospiraceae bacterium]|nr:transcription antitermination factor NusB [Lachnospiraceae bacterium]